LSDLRRSEPVFSSRSFTQAKSALPVLGDPDLGSSDDDLAGGDDG
jgi:hypothetical protein